MAGLEIHQFPCLSDNFGVLVHDPDSGATASIDAPDANAIEAHLAAKGWRLTHLFITHHHRDHTGGNEALKAATGCRISGPRAEAGNIPAIDEAVDEGDRVAIGRFEFQVIATPGHTAGHICYWCQEANVAFVGDTLFAMGCGRLLEGSTDTMWESLQKLMRLPPETNIYCGHEYTVANARFARSVDPENQAVHRRAREAEARRAEGKPTLPTRLDLELATNPFLRAADPGIAARIGMSGASPSQVFAELRSRKNRG